MQYISLDGNSLTSTDLVNLGRGLYKIKVMFNKLYWSSRSSVLIFDLRNHSPVPTFSADSRGREKSGAIQRPFGHHSQRKQRFICIKNKDFNQRENNDPTYSLLFTSRPVSLVVYGITTGFGKFARTVIPVSKLK